MPLPRRRAVIAGALPVRVSDARDRAQSVLAPLGVAMCLLYAPVLSAEAAAPIIESADRCTVQALDKFADTRAMFSQEASSGAMSEALVDVRNCDFSNKDLSKKVLSGVLLSGADFSSAKLTGIQMSRAIAIGANLSNVDFTDANCYGTLFNGADLHGAQFENSILTGAAFGKDSDGNWANLAGAHFEGALLSSSDIERMCQNPTLDDSTRRFELGCRKSK